jgi:hypothetical protein
MAVIDVELDHTWPTPVPSEQLYRWTKFLTGEPRQGFRYGAVRPSLQTGSWYAAAISPDTTLIASRRLFSTPEDAVEWLRAAVLWHAFPEADRSDARSKRQPGSKSRR